MYPIWGDNVRQFIRGYSHLWWCFYSGSSENEEDVVNKYRALVSDIREKEKKSSSGTDMEVSWIPSDVVNEQVKIVSSQ